MADEAYEIIGDSDKREEWLEARRSGIGGSDAPAILGLTSWASPASVQADKWGLLEEPDDAEILQWGHRLEPVILQALGEEMGTTIEQYGKLLRSKKHPFMLCTPDGLTKEGVFVQAKNTIRADEWVDGPPPRVYVQCQHEMAVTGELTCIVAALILGSRLRWAWLERNEKFIQEVLIPAEKEFWDLTMRNEPCAADASEHTRKAYQILWPQDTGERVELDGFFTDLDVERTALLSQKLETEKRLAAIDNEFRRAMGSATTAALPNGATYTLKTQIRKAYEVKESTFRVLRRMKEKK